MSLDQIISHPGKAKQDKNVKMSKICSKGPDFLLANLFEKTLKKTTLRQNIALNF